MSLICDETGRDIEFGEPLHCGGRCDATIFSALCKDVIDPIPARLRRKKPCKSGKGGVDIHSASSTENFNGSYTFCDFRHGGFLFSISPATAKRYLPKHYVHLNENIEVVFGVKSRYQKDDCINRSADYMCPNPSTLEACCTLGKFSAAVRCCENDACKKRAAELALIGIGVK